MDYIKFKTTGGWECCVKSKYMSNRPDASRYDLYDLITGRPSIKDFLHNSTGPALRFSKYDEFWVNGNPIFGEEKEKMEHHERFHNSFERLLDD